MVSEEDISFCMYELGQIREAMGGERERGVERAMRAVTLLPAMKMNRERKKDQDR